MNIKTFMQRTIDTKQPSPKFFGNFFGKKETIPTRILEIDSRFRGVRVANFVNPNAVADGTEKLTFTENQFVIPTIKDIQTITPTELEKRMAGENVYIQKTEADRLGRMVAEIQTEQMQMITDKFELMATEAVFNGKVTVVGKGENRVIDFKRDTEMFVDLGTGNYWNTPTANSANDIQDVIVKMGEFGKSVDIIVGRVSTMSQLAKNLKDTDEYDNRRIDNGSLKFKSFADVNGSVFFGTYKGAELWGYNGSYADSEGNVQNAVPEKLVAFISKDNGNLDVAGVTPIISKHFKGDVSDMKVVAGKRHYLSTLKSNDEVLQVGAIHTRCPVLADTRTAMILQVEA